MQTISSRKAREKFKEILDNASRGETISIMRRGKEVARMVPPEHPNNGVFPDMTEFRKRLRGKVKGKSLTQTVIEMRNEERL
ncbi:MAG: type II toxin-antitoxin system prevent-host-death family antitoxin [Phycisphaerae bacterium]|nr:type II toxin-antitoxin system prevent-host-death family antitoxin [Phycisphaerae bacterium]